MKNRHRILALLLTASVLSTAIPVSASDGTIGETTISSTEETLGTEDYLRTETNLKNSITITDEIAKENNSNNIMFSPASLHFALGLLAEGASEETRNALNHFLGTDSYSEFAKKYMDFVQERNSSEEEEKNGYKQKLNIANAIWADQALSLKDEFCKAAEDCFHANVQNTDFANADEACKQINAWADEQTEHLIPEIISPDLLSSETGLILTNSIYFESPWSGDAWTKTGVKEIFHGTQGAEEIEYMTSNGDEYFENDKATAFSRYYQNGLQFIGILPKEEGDFQLKDLDIHDLLASTPEYSKVNCKMPSLNFSTDLQLREILTDMGLGNLFSDEADFSGLTDTPVKVDSVIQKTKLELDENGTKAAAVTAAMMEKCAFMPDEPELVKEVTLDRPFAFLIYDAENQEVLFMGKIITALK